MSSNRVVLVALSVLLVLNAGIDGKKVRRKRPKAEEDAAFPQPNVLTYSNFGFNDVGSYDGFVPSSSDYASFLSGGEGGGKEESTTRLYAPAFPTAMDTSGFSNGFGSHFSDGQTFNTGSDGQQLGLFHLEPSMNTFGFMNVEPSNENKFSDSDSRNGYSMEKSNMPVYGAKINFKSKSKPYEENNDQSFKTFTTDPSTTYSSDKSNEKYYKPKKRHQSFDNNRQTTTESSLQQNKGNNVPNYDMLGVEPFMKMPFNNSSNLLNFPRVVDFTNSNKQYYQNDFQVNYPQNYIKPINIPSSVMSTSQESNDYKNHGDKFFKVTSSLKEGFEYKDDKIMNKIKAISNDDKFQNYPNLKYKGTVTNAEYKDKYKAKPWKTNNDTPPTTSNDIPVSSSKFISSNEDSKSGKSTMKGYQYSTNHSTTSFKYDIDEPKQQFNHSIDEIVPASSNVDLLDYRFPSTDYNNFNKIPSLKPQNEDDSDISISNQNQYKSSEDYLNSFKNLYTSTPTSTSNWGNIFKSTEYSFNKSHKRKPQNIDENINDDVVHIPKRPQTPKHENYDFKFEDVPTDFSLYNNYRPHKPKRPYDWSKEISSTRFKSEEDLLGLRTRDTLRPSFLPTYSSVPNELPDENNYKRLVDKWRIDYLKAKQKEAFHDYESFASDTRPIHVPLPKPYPIEVPHPVIVPVPQPYPVHVPVPRPVAVPVIQELMVPIEKPVPYPVVKKVPYPIEKPVPVRVEKQVPVPVDKPYAVPIPKIMPVFHHSKHRDEYNNLDHDDDAEYVPRPEGSKRVPYAKRPRSTRNRHRRPQRTAYSERSRRRWPQHEAAESKDRRYYKRPSSTSMETYPRHRQHEKDFVDLEKEDKDYLAYVYCKKTGNC